MRSPAPESRDACKPLKSAGAEKANNNEMTVITTSSSMSVNACLTR
jgi:hypothetical protein